MIIQRLFSKKKPEEPNKTAHIIQGGVLGYMGGNAGEAIGKVISSGRQAKEVMKRINEELPKRAAAGDEKAAEMLSKVRNNPKVAGKKISEAIKNSPRTNRAGKIGKAVGVAVPVALVSASYTRDKKKYEKYKADKKDKEGKDDNPKK